MAIKRVGIVGWSHGGLITLMNIFAHPKDYAVAFTGDELARLQHIFPNGVCDWSRPGVNEVPITPVASVGQL